MAIKMTHFSSDTGRPRLREAPIERIRVSPYLDHENSISLQRNYFVNL